MKCLDCRFSDMDIEGDLMTMICRRYPPTIIGIGDTEHAAETGHDAGIAWPVVQEDDWCGEFEQTRGRNRGPR